MAAAGRERKTIAPDDAIASESIGGASAGDVDRRCDVLPRMVSFSLRSTQIEKENFVLNETRFTIRRTSARAQNIPAIVFEFSTVTVRAN